MIANILKLQERAIARELYNLFHSCKEDDIDKMMAVREANADVELNYYEFHPLGRFPYESSTSYNR